MFCWHFGGQNRTKLNVSEQKVRCRTDMSAERCDLEVKGVKPSTSSTLIQGLQQGGVAKTVLHLRLVAFETQSVVAFYRNKMLKEYTNMFVIHNLSCFSFLLKLLKNIPWTEPVVSSHAEKALLKG